MFKIYKYLKPLDWFFVVLIVGITVLQVYFTMTCVDYVQYTMEEIMKLASNPGAGRGDLWKNAGLLVAFAAGNGVCQVCTCFLAAQVAAGLSATLRRNLFSNVNSFSTAEINTFSTASLITRSTNDVQQVQMANVMILRMLITAPITAIWAICKIQAASMELTWATIIAVVLLVVAVVAIVCVVLPKFRIIQKLTDKLNSVERENLTGIRVVRAFNAQEYQEEKFETANENFKKTQLFANRVMNLMNPVMMFIMSGLTLAIYILGAYLMNKLGVGTEAAQEQYATITAFVMLATQIVMAFLMLLMMFILLPRAQVAATRINNVLETTSSVTDPEFPEKCTEKGTVEFKNVAFKYPDSDENVIEGISFRAEPGETVAFIGATGSGKSTLINLVPRFYDVTEGEVFVDGVNVKNLKQHDLRDKIGYVPQKGVLFTGTVAENIGYGGDADVDRVKMVAIEKAARIAEADGFIQEMGGYDAFIAQGGTNVSGGQKQRLCIARAAAFEPEIMIFDDSFSALDFKTDKKVRQNIEEEMKGTTRLIVAQRIGTIMDADKIIVLSEGRAVGYGNHHDLLRNCDTYRDIALSQLTPDELGFEPGEVDQYVTL
ncbi:MAG: ABC transporter ATP-binding protein/permease [Clostridia bacterium]|nr:ABC transporter ATP-binding protein/permease [Clostridia bacterium]